MAITDTRNMSRHAMCECGHTVYWHGAEHHNCFGMPCNGGPKDDPCRDACLECDCKKIRLAPPSSEHGGAGKEEAK